MVKFVTIKEKKYPIKIGYFVLSQVQEEFGKDYFTLLQEIHDTKNVKPYEFILYHALIQGAWEMETDMPFELNQMGNVLDSCFLEFLAVLATTDFFPQAPESKTPPEGKDKGPKKSPRKT